MSDPTRLLDGGGTDAERGLLEAGRDEVPDLVAKRRAAAALAIGVAASVWPAAASATAAKASKAGVPLLVKLLAIGAVSVGTLGTVHYIRTKAHAPPPPVTAQSSPAAYSTVEAAPTPQPRTATEKTEPATPVEALELERPAEPAKAASGAAHGSATPPSLSDEMRQIDQARRALSAGDGAGALRALDEYRRQYPHGAFSQEAVLLRIQALVQTGNPSAAKALADSFRAKNPNSPHLRRIDSVLGEQ